jgi:hypothetical protein
VTDGIGCPLEGAAVTVRSPSGETGAATTDAHGAYRITLRELGTHTVAATLLGFATEHTSVAFAGEKTSLDIGMRVADLTESRWRLTGTVLTDDARPLADVTVTLLRVDGAQRQEQTRSDSAGRFTFVTSSPGDYAILGRLAGYAPGLRPARLWWSAGSNGGHAEIEVQLTRTGTTPCR